MTTFSHQYAQPCADASASAQVARHVTVRFRPAPLPLAWFVAQLLALALHAALAWWAMQTPFHHRDLTVAEIALRQGETAEAVNLRMVTVKIDLSTTTFAPPTPTKANPDAPIHPDAVPPTGAIAGPKEGAAPKSAANTQSGASEVIDSLNPAAPPALPPVLAAGVVVPVQEPAPVERTEATTAAAASPSLVPFATPAGDASPPTNRSLIASVAPTLPRATGADAAVATQIAPVMPPLPEIEVTVNDVTHSSAPSSQAEAGVRQGIDVANLPKPSYPLLSRRLKEQGMVVLDVQVFADGKVGRVEVVKAPPHQRLIDAAIEAVRKATFKPATVDGRAVADVVRIPFIFRLE
ncbi:MAG: energy transducer TonB [Phycisphaeraceae bacterium]